jgi:hypothetical protein
MFAREPKASVTMLVEVDVDHLTVRYAWPGPGEESVMVTECFDALHSLALCYPGLMPDTLADQIHRNYLPSATVAELQALGQNLPLKFRGFLDQIFKESCCYLTSLESSVRDGKCVNEAVDFCRWLQFSGVLSMLEMFAEVDPEFARLRHRVTDLMVSCADHLRGGKISATYCQSDIASINLKLDFLISAFARTAAPIVQNALDQCA